jgi:hypothetical protein
VKHLTSSCATIRIDQEVISDLRELLNSGEYIDVYNATKALASIPNLTLDHRKQIIEDCWVHLQQLESSLLPRTNSFELLSLIAKIGGVEAREQVISYYCRFERSYPSAYSYAPQLLRTAGSLWSQDELPELRNLIKADHPGIQALAIVALSKLGERQDLNPIIEYIKTPQWVGPEGDRRWLAQQIARLFNAQDLDFLHQELQAGYDSEYFAHPVLFELCQRLDEKILLKMLNDSDAIFQKYAAEGLVAIGKSAILLEYEHLVDSNYLPLSQRVAMGLAASGNWEVIDRLMESEVYGLYGPIAEGLRFVKDKQVFDYLFQLLHNDDVQAQLKAGESLAIIGDEEMLHKIVYWLVDHPYEPGADMVKDVLRHLDHRLYCPIQQSINMERDFSSLRYSMFRNVA